MANSADDDAYVPRFRLKENKDHNFITLSWTEYGELLKDRGEYQALRSALLAGGVPQENLDLLISQPLCSPEGVTDVQDYEVEPVQRPKWPHKAAEAEVYVPRSRAFGARQTSSSPFGSSVPGLVEDGSGTDAEKSEDIDACVSATSEQYDNDSHQDRSLIFRGLPPSSSLANLLKHVRGGCLLHCYTRAKSAHVSFADPVAAEKFIMYSKRADLYIQGKRIEVSWDERQHYMPEHIARLIAEHGVTRNLIIRFPTTEMTPDSIREDLEHIHHLEVVNINFVKGHAYVSLNSVYHALRAKSCMKSRLKYKATRIEFYQDECDQPLPDISRRLNSNTSHTVPKKAAAIAVSNRFDVIGQMNDLSCDDEEPDLSLLDGGAPRSTSD